MQRPSTLQGLSILVLAAAVAASTAGHASAQDRARREARTQAPSALATGGSLILEVAHTDWPDYPALPPMVDDEPIKFDPFDIRRPGTHEGDRFKRRPNAMQIEEHTDWPDYPDGIGGIGITPAPEPTDPHVIFPLPGEAPDLTDLIGGTSFPGLGGISLNDTFEVPLPTPTPAPIPAPGGALLILALGGATAARRRRA
ncbi:MAG: hypothetical protein ACTS3F_01390 [Phycisphaerales bacterium]